MHKETRRLDVELFANVLADLSRIKSALAAGTRFPFVEMFQSRQMIGQRLTTSMRTGAQGNAGSVAISAACLVNSASAAARSLAHVS